MANVLVAAKWQLLGDCYYRCSGGTSISAATKLPTPHSVARSLSVATIPKSSSSTPSPHFESSNPSTPSAFLSPTSFKRTPTVAWLVCRGVTIKLWSVSFRGRDCWDFIASFFIFEFLWLLVFFVWGLLLKFYCDGGKIFRVLFVGPACGWWLGCWPVGMVELVMGLIWMVAEFYLCSFFLCEYGWIGMGEKKKMKAFFQVSARSVLLGGCSGFGLVVSGWEREKNRETENKDEERRKWDFFNTILFYNLYYFNIL